MNEEQQLIKNIDELKSHKKNVANIVKMIDDMLFKNETLLIELRNKQ